MPVLTRGRTAPPDLSSPTPRSELLAPGEAWSDAALADLSEMASGQRRAWRAMLEHAGRSGSGGPSRGWLAKSRTLIDDLGEDVFRQRVLAWFTLVDRPRTLTVEHRGGWGPDPNHLIIPAHAEVLCGLAWSCSLLDDTEVARGLTELALSAYRKIPVRGPRAVKIGNACIWALGEAPGRLGIGPLAILKARVRSRATQTCIDGALHTIARRLGISREEIEEIAVPTYRMQAVGTRREPLGRFTAVLHITGTSSTQLRWVKPDGKEQKSVPKAVREDPAQANALAALRSDTKAIKRMLSAQRDRIDALFVQNPSWTYSAWRERYLDHPLVGTLARRIIWRFETEDGAATGMWWDGRLVDASGQAMTWVDDHAQVRLWHPIDASVNEISAWRSWLLEHRVQQPFKQAHREIYVLTDAERSTGTYSNRFAAHILKQHQFNALCRVRGWRNALRLAVDAIYEPPTIDLPQWDLRAELWVQGIMDDPGFQEGVDITEAGSYLYVATDQLRFYQRHAAPNWAHAQGGPYESAGGDIELNHPVPLEDVPVLALSEVMRDVDLFVGVASVGNDPAWADGGSDTRFLDYARRYNMGNLSALAKTRKALLEQLVPRLAIADRCHVREQHLVVRGELRIYKIHLGSGNILMEPNDQYLCIVPKAADRRRGSEDVFLPFEGDRMLSIILSKAFMLVADNTITDGTIRRQIGA